MESYIYIYVRVLFTMRRTEYIYMLVKELDSWYEHILHQ